MSNIIFLTNDSIESHLGQSQILQYVNELNHYHSIDIISKGSSLNEYNSYFGWIKGVFLKTQNSVDIIHCRGYIACWTALFIKLITCRKFKVLFDARGLWVDERIENNQKIIINLSKIFRFLEKWAYEKADFVLTLTLSHKNYVMRKFNIVDSDVIRTAYESKNQFIQINKRKDQLIFSGTIGGYYDPESIFNVFKLYLNFSNTNEVLILSKTSKHILENYIKTYRLDKSRVTIMSVPHNQIGQYLSKGKIGLIYFDNTTSAIGRNPTKFAEYLAFGLKVLMPNYIADVDVLSEYASRGAGYSVFNNKKDVEIALKELVKNDFNYKPYLEKPFTLSYVINKYLKTYEILHNK